MEYNFNNEKIFFLKLDNLLIDFKENIKIINNIYELKILKSKFLGKNSFIFKSLKNISKLNLDIKKKIGNKLNNIKNDINNIYIEYKNKLLYNLISVKIEELNINLPGRKIKIGSFHPISIAILKIEKYFNNLGFKIFNCCEIENSYYNFDALNILKNHPSRSKKDTFWIDNVHLLRTQTSCAQIRFLEKNKPPLKIISYGKVYRNDKDKTHTPMFHQLDGFMIDEHVNLKLLKDMLENFIFYFFDNKKIKIKFRQSYFPFTEPSLELDIKDKFNNWVEILGCGLIHTNILKKSKININKYIGLAFGIGIERLIMLKYNINDIKILFDNNIRFLSQFSYINN